MPIITIEITPQKVETKAEIARIFTDELSRLTGIPKEPITVLFHEQPPTQIANGGQLLSEKLPKHP